MNVSPAQFIGQELEYSLGKSIRVHVVHIVVACLTGGIPGKQPPQQCQGDQRRHTPLGTALYDLVLLLDIARQNFRLQVKQLRDNLQECVALLVPCTDCHIHTGYVGMT